MEEDGFLEEVDVCLEEGGRGGGGGTSRQFFFLYDRSPYNEHRSVVSKDIQLQHLQMNHLIFLPPQSLAVGWRYQSQL